MTRGTATLAERENQFGAKEGHTGLRFMVISESLVRLLEQVGEQVGRTPEELVAEAIRDYLVRRSGERG